MKTYMAKTADQTKRGWYHVDATDQVMGRLATKLAKVLMGKHRPTYTPHVDMGDFVVVTNVGKIRLTGNKAESKEYPYYTGYIGGLKANTFSEFVESGRAEETLKLAVKRMLPKSKLGRQMLGKLKAYHGSEHPHGAQNPQPLDLEKI
ncbi:MAG: 50S ribosomal protein L13 [Planctomycetota bacterium]